MTAGRLYAAYITKNVCTFSDLGDVHQYKDDSSASSATHDCTGTVHGQPLLERCKEFLRAVNFPHANYHLAMASYQKKKSIDHFRQACIEYNLPFQWGRDQIHAFLQYIDKRYYSAFTIRSYWKVCLFSTFKSLTYLLIACGLHTLTSIQVCLLWNLPVRSNINPQLHTFDISISGMLCSHVFVCRISCVKFIFASICRSCVMCHPCLVSSWIKATYSCTKSVWRSAIPLKIINSPLLRNCWQNYVMQLR